MAALWGMDWVEERMEAERWFWVVIMDRVALKSVVGF